ncbi:MAG: 1,2-diacylglycerol 3-glucosyltransferase [Candidatus Adlerbacteria bacterium]|nr:1,2-diacylglycerol 3-glucosyltransferase [Candidatus Adlerbacteria bacterium]
MKRVLIFSLAYYPRYVGGAEVAIKEKTDRITDIEFHMVTLRYDSTLPKVEKVGNVLVHRIGFTRPNATMADLKKFPLHYNKYWFQFAAAFKALSLNHKYRYDATWAMMAHSTGVPAALFKLFKPKVPYVLELQEGDPPEYIEKLMRPLWPLFSRAFTTATVVSVISTFLGRWAKSRGFKGSIELVPNAVNTKHFSQQYEESELAALKEKLGKKEGDVYIITTSRLVHKNAIDDVISALALLPKNIYFLILGIGPDEDKLKALAKDLSVSERVKWIGQVDHKEMPKYLKVSDIFTRPSRSEGMGNSFVEAMAAELPVIATQEGGIADFLFDAKRNPNKPVTGWAVDRDNPTQIAEAVGEILGNPEQVRTVIQNARELAFSKYDWDLIARDMREKVFAKVLS